MSETKNPGEKKLSVSGKTLTLKPRTETGVVRQSFSHGRSKQVVVEKVRSAASSADRAKPRWKPRLRPRPKKARRRPGTTAAPAQQPALHAERLRRSRPASCCAP